MSAPVSAAATLPGHAGDVLPGNAAMFAITAALGGWLVASPNGLDVVRARFDPTGDEERL